ncbi:hypothetical protein [Streptomyces sp. TP-A0356]|uniref:hypothetical protein n=1 Tax=Streptomyces sp. TP-A0356 TaxID=1359208 RepID=UPI0006E3F3C7|nr:hypothetical protein [Streptomyces sp. TP-A0356]
MNRAALGLAVGAGYVLGRTKKMKLAFALGTLAAGKRMQLSPRALADLVNQQLRDNPQFKEIGDQLRHDLRGAGKAASGALLERQIEGIAGRLHSRTEQVRGQLSGAASQVSDLTGPGEESEEGRAEGEAADSEEAAAPEEEESPPPKKAARKAPPSKRPAKKAPAKQAGPKAANKAAAKKAPAKKAPAKKTAGAQDGGRGSSGEGRR